MFHDVLPLVMKNFKSIKGHYLFKKRKKKNKANKIIKTTQGNNASFKLSLQLGNAKNLIKITKSEKDTALFCSFRACYLSDVSSCVLKCHKSTTFCQKTTLCHLKLIVRICYQNAYLLQNRYFEINREKSAKWRHLIMEALFLCKCNPYLKKQCCQREKKERYGKKSF